MGEEQGEARPEGPGARDAAGPAPGGGQGREYRTAELAEAAGITVRTLRFYRERRLLPPPRREGRIAWYNDAHLARLRTIAALLERGHTLSGVAELIAAFSGGRDRGETAELLGLAERAPWAEEEPVRLTPEELAGYFEGEVSAGNLAAALDIGYLAVDGEELVHVSRGLLEASSELVRTGLPLAAVLEAGRRLREQADALAGLFTGLLRTHLLPTALPGHEPGAALSEEDVKKVTELVERLRPLAKQVVNAEISLAVDRRLRAELDERTLPADHG
ncbi:MerR family transcriptional regulator [Streptomyces sp. YIM 98790]|uniref:MerR family transcriptional regulator n=1 Tax=Streptomyces sp. YIM 98790 TaxID=2689077 RepID=UPI00140C1351|nr:MerR family transcriptional regulator [Streptomyces sp. YIM 98790]